MNAIIFLCGNNESGKTTTLDNLFSTQEKGKIGQTSFFQKTLSDKKIFVVGTDSPQEKHEIKFLYTFLYH